MKAKDPYVFILVGLPLSGKSTWIRRNYPDAKVISRDDLVLEVYGSDNYSEAFKNVDQKEVDRTLDLRLKDANLNKENVIVDMTNLTTKRRKQTLRYFSDDYYKEVVVFPILDKDEYASRNKERNERENKWIPPFVITSMLESYIVPTLDEGFDKITILDKTIYV
jgi:predicted kinase